MGPVESGGKGASAPRLGAIFLTGLSRDQRLCFWPAFPPARACEWRCAPGLPPGGGNGKGGDQIPCGRRLTPLAHATRFLADDALSGWPWPSNLPTTCGPYRIETARSRCSWIITVQPANVFRKAVLPICHTLSPILTVLSWATTRSLCTAKIQFRSARAVLRKAVPFSLARTVNFSLNSAM